MKKLILLFICICCLFSINGISQSKKSKAKKAKQNKETVNFVCQLPASVLGITLNQKEIFAKCSVASGYCSERSSQIEVKVSAVAGDKDKFVYTVSGGKVIGEGVNIIWDLSDAKPGTYTITSGISQPIFNGERWEVLGKTQTYTVTVRECPDCK